MKISSDMQWVSKRSIDFSNKYSNKNTNNTESTEKSGEKNSSLKITSQNKKNDIWENLQKQKDSLNEQKNKLKETAMDPKEKKERLKDLDGKIADVEAQMQQFVIQQKQDELDKQKKEIEKKQAQEDQNNANTNANGDEVRDGVIVSASLTNLLKAGTSIDNIHRLNQIKKSEAIEAGYLGSTDNPNSFNARRMVQIRKSAVNADMNISRQIGNMNKAVIANSEKIKNKVEAVKDGDKEQEAQVDENGQVIDGKGQVVDGNGQAFDKNGQVVDGNGQPVDENGQAINKKNNN